MPNWFSTIEANAAKAGRPSRVWKANSGRLLLLPHGAKIVGCEMEGIDHNLFWHNAGLEDPATAATNLASGGANVGGDRLWLGPEIGLHWPDLHKARKTPWEDYFVPASVDPSSYQMAEEADGHVRFTTEMHLKDHRTNKKATARVSRQFNLISPPPGLPKGLKSISFAIQNQLTLLEADAGIGLGTWDLLQIPNGGTLITPTTSEIKKPRIYYGKFTTTHFKIKRDHIQFKLDGKRQLKFGLNPVQTTGRMGYYRKAGRVSTFIFRVFSPLPGEPYVDVPLTSDEFTGGDALQSYNDSGQFGGFGEMEYHDAGLIAGQNPASRTSSCVTHVLAGPDGAIRKAATMLLGVKI